MAQCVLFQVTGLRKGFITLQASIRLHPAMCPSVYCENLECCEIVATMLAGEVHAGRRVGTDWEVWREALEVQRVVDTKHCWCIKVRVMDMFG